MVCPDVAHKIRTLYIKTRSLLSGALIGDYSTAVKGCGLEFDQIREYQAGDDIRHIDWNSCARSGKLLVKQYLEERNRRIILLVDCSGSSFIASQNSMRYDAIAQMAGILTLVAQYGKDNVGLLLFSDTVHHFIPPGRGQAHTHAIIQKIFEQSPTTKPTNIRGALSYIMERSLQKSILFVISDCIGSFEDSLAQCARKHEVVMIRCIDQFETQLAAAAVTTLHDPETGETLSFARINQANALLKERLNNQNMVFKKYGIDRIDILDYQESAGTLIRFLKKRMVY